MKLAHTCYKTIDWSLGFADLAVTELGHDQNIHTLLHK